MSMSVNNPGPSSSNVNGPALGTRSKGAIIEGAHSSISRGDGDVGDTPREERLSDPGESDSDSDMAVSPDKFDGTCYSPSSWLEDVKAYADVKRYNDSQSASLLRFLFAGDAKIWYGTLSDVERSSFAAFRTAFDNYWVIGPRRPNLGHRQKELANMTQKPGQSAIDFVNAVVSKANGLDLSDVAVLRVIESGLRPEFLPFFKQAKPTRPNDLLTCEALQAVPAAVSATVGVDLIEAIDHLLSSKLAALNLTTHGTSPPAVNAIQPPQQRRQWNQRPSINSLCRNCGKDCWGGKCAASGAICHYCQKRNHFSSVCLSKRRQEGQQFRPPSHPAQYPPRPTPAHTQQRHRDQPNYGQSLGNAHRPQGFNRRNQWQSQPLE